MNIYGEWYEILSHIQGIREVQGLPITQALNESKTKFSGTGDHLWVSEFFVTCQLDVVVGILTWKTWSFLKHLLKSSTLDLADIMDWNMVEMVYSSACSVIFYFSWSIFCVFSFSSRHLLLFLNFKQLNASLCGDGHWLLWSLSLFVASFSCIKSPKKFYNARKRKGERNLNENVSWKPLDSSHSAYKYSIAYCVYVHK